MRDNGVPSAPHQLEHGQVLIQTGACPVTVPVGALGTLFSPQVSAILQCFGTRPVA